jgi:hypothetical protein
MLADQMNEMTHHPSLEGRLALVIANSTGIEDFLFEFK